MRPYYYEAPTTVTVFAKLERIVEVFRLMHLRHIVVLSPSDGSIAGIITRKDIFAYMSL